MGLLHYRPSRVRPGTKELPAKLLNDLLDTVRALAKMKVGPGLKLSKSSTGYMLTMSRLPDNRVEVNTVIAAFDIPALSTASYAYQSLELTIVQGDPNDPAQDILETLTFPVMDERGEKWESDEVSPKARQEGPIYNRANVRIPKDTRMDILRISKAEWLVINAYICKKA